VIPTESGLLTVQAFYEWIPDRTPALTGVVAVHGGRTSESASLAAVFGAPLRSAEVDGRLRLRVARVYAAMQDALRQGDWMAFGRAMAELRRLANER